MEIPNLYSERNVNEAIGKLNTLISDFFIEKGYTFKGAGKRFAIWRKEKDSISIKIQPKKVSKKDEFFTTGEYELHYIKMENYIGATVVRKREQITDLEKNLIEDLQSLKFAYKKTKIKSIF